LNTNLLKQFTAQNFENLPIQSIIPQTDISHLNLDLNKSTFNLDSSAVLDANDINLKLTSGKFNASETTLGNVEISSNAQGVIILGTCSLLKSPDEEKITGGRIEAEHIEKLYFTGSDTDIYIKETTTIVDITLTNSGCVEIKKISGTADIVTSKGDIDINSCTPDLLSLWATTTKGDIKIKNAYNKIFTETTSGNVLTEFANDTAPVSLSNTYTSYFNGKTKTGKIVVTGLTRADVEVEDGSADLTFSNFNKNLSIVNTINSKNGNVYIKVDSASAFVLNSFTKGNSRINLLQTEVYKGWTEKTVNENINYAKNETVDELTANYVNITVSESGNVLMHDNKVN